MFSCEYYEIFKDRFLYRIPLVAASKLSTANDIQKFENMYS